MNDIPGELFVNITDAGWEWGFVCVEHKSFIPCRACLYQSPATIPYSETKEDRKLVNDWHDE
jgi:hypothetical protein